MILTRFAFARQRVTLVALFCLFAAGILAYRDLPRAEDPGFTVRLALVTTIFPGASPERVEELVTARIEEAAQQIPEVSEVQSISTASRSMVFVELALDVQDLAPAWTELRRRVDDVRRDLPDEAWDPIVNDRFGEVFGILVAVTAEGYTDVERKEFAEDLKEELLRLDDAARVVILGDQPRRIFLTYQNARLAEYGLSPLYLADVLQKQNIVSPGGTIPVDAETLAVEPSGSFESVTELAATPIAVPGGALLTIGDLAEVTEGTIDPPDPRYRFRGREGHLVAISMRDGGDILTLGEQVRHVLRKMRGRYPIGVEFDEANFAPDDVDAKVSSFMGNLAQAVLIVIGVMVLALGFRTGLVVASLIPSAIISTFLLMGLYDVGIDQMSLAALLIALGMLVDNAIVMSENALVRMDAGATGEEAAIGASEELWAPLLVSSLTTCAAFLPFYIAQGEATEYISPIFLVVTMTLLASWFLSMTMVPLACAWGLRPSGTGDQVSRWAVPYQNALWSLLRHPWLTLAVSTAALLLALAGLTGIPVRFFPPSEKAAATLEVHLAPATDPAEADRVAETLDRYIATLARGEDPLVRTWSTMVGDSMPRFALTFNGPWPDSGALSSLIHVRDREAVDEVAALVQSFVEDNFPDALATAQPLQLGPYIPHPVAFEISGDDIGSLFAKADEALTLMRETPGTRSVSDDWGWRTKKVEVQVDPIRARLAGVTNQDVATSLYTGLAGIEVTSFRDGDEAVPVVIRGDIDDRLHVGELDVFPMTGGAPVPLTQVADLELDFQASRIRRVDRRRTITVSSGVAPGANANSLASIFTRYFAEASRGWEPGYRWEDTGEAAKTAESNGAVFAVSHIAALAIIMLLVVQFNSLRRSAINLFVLPYALVGVTVGLLVTSSYMGFMTLLGVISLFGVVINNANVLIDRIDIEIAEGKPPARAIVEASYTRLRPIVLTTATTVAGLIPLWLGGGPMFQPMAIVLVFGLIFGTLLTLGLVPVLYSLAFRVKIEE